MPVDNRNYRQKTLILHNAQADFLEKAAKKLNMPESRLMRNIVDAGIRDLEAWEKVGLLDLVGAYRKSFSHFKQLDIEAALSIA